MASIFKDVEAHAVVTAKGVRDLTGTSTQDFQFSNSTTPDADLDALLNTWVDRMASHMYVRLGRSVVETDGDYLGLVDVLERTVANLVAVAQQQRSSPIVQIDSFAVSVMTTSKVTEHLADELAPFLRYHDPDDPEGNSGFGGRVNIFSSLEEYTP